MPALLVLALPLIFPWIASAHVNQIPILGEKTTRNVAIIGGGSAGASAAYFVNKFAPSYGHELESVQVSLYEASDRIGGRAKAVNIPVPHSKTGETVSIEIGASIFVIGNKHLMDAVREFNLTFTSTEADGDSGGTSGSDRPTSKNPELGIYNGTHFIFTARSENTWQSLWDAAWRWGLVSPYRARSLALSTAAQFGNAYALENLYRVGYKTVREMLFQGFGMDSAVLSTSAKAYFLAKGVNEAFLTEFVEPATRVNYGQNLDCNALAALICLTAAFTPADSVVGGNSLIYEKMINHSNAAIHMNTRIGEVRKESNGMYTLWDIGGQRLGEFNDVIVAVPSTASRNINFSSLQRQPKPIEFVHLHVTLITGSINPAYFKLAESNQIPSAILTTASAGPAFNSIGTRYAFNDAQNTTVTKIFSSSRITDEFISQVYSRSDRIDRFEWDAYPILNPLYTAEEMAVVLDNGVYNVNEFERAFSAMEGQTVASANVVQLMLDSWQQREFV
ncbi:Prenylcysteine lyase-domain-containing protein [Obelidium mucronatum]|nr:Prenylcysteine lyase-domain-containing protein [Obelidium mucronatum]